MYLPSLWERAALALNCLTEYCDHARGNLPYFYARLSEQPPSAMLHLWSYGDGLGRSLDALALLRRMMGQSVMDYQGDRTMIASLISLLGVDNLSWCPAEPWTMAVPHTRPAWLQQGTLQAFASLYQVTGDEEYRRLAEANIEAVRKLAVWNAEKQYAYFPGDYYTRANGWGPALDDPMHRPSVFYTSMAMPLLRYFRLTGHEPALALASGLIRWALADHDDGRRLFELGHFHCQSRLVTALLLRGISTSNDEDMALAERLYLKARQLGTESGWFPEQINNPDHNRSNLSETCCLADMIEAAILLAQHRRSAYWHDVERFVRNHLLVHQIVDTQWFARMTPIPRHQHVLCHPYEPDTGSTDGVLQNESLKQSLLGGFAGWGAVTAMSDDTVFSNSNQHCCNATGARAIYDAWRYAVMDDGQRFQINLYLHRAHAAANILVDEAWEAAQGTLTIQAKQARRISLRVPEFTAADELAVVCNGNPVDAAANNGYIDIVPEVLPGSVIEVTYPLKLRTTHERIAPGSFTFQWAGPTVLSAEPVQKIRPLFVPDRFLTAVPEIGTGYEREIDSL